MHTVKLSVWAVQYGPDAALILKCPLNKKRVFSLSLSFALSLCLSLSSLFSSLALPLSLAHSLPFPLSPSFSLLSLPLRAVVLSLYSKGRQSVTIQQMWQTFNINPKPSGLLITKAITKSHISSVIPRQRVNATDLKRTVFNICSKSMTSTGKDSFHEYA